MNIALFGATGMVGQGVLRECLLDPQVKRVVSFGRHPVSQRYAKLHNIVLNEAASYRKALRRFPPFDACFFCIGSSSFCQSADLYEHINHELPILVARALLPQRRRLTFVYLSAAGADPTEKGSSRWARVKGRTENELLRMSFKRVFLFRPAYIHPANGEVSKTALYRRLYQAVDRLYPLWRCLFPSKVTTTEAIGRAMLAVAKKGYEKPYLETNDINRLFNNQDS
jgi:hypothetical protein